MICGNCKTEGVGVQHVRQCFGVDPAPVEPFDDGVTIEGDQTQRPWTDAFGFDPTPDESGAIGHYPNDEAIRVDGYRGSDFFKNDSPRVDLNVPYAERNQVKNLGGKWDRDGKVWWMTEAAVNQYRDQMPAHWFEPKSSYPVAGRGPSHQVEPGLYQSPVTGAIYLAYFSTYLEFMLAKRLIIKERDQYDGNSFEKYGEWSKGSKADYNKLRNDWAVSLDKAKEFGKAFGFCMRCGRVLENPASIEAGIGPKCATYF